jgi:hypothetical protein
MRVRFILPLIGLLLFAIGSYASLRFNRLTHPNSHKYFWWSSIRLDSDPLNRHPDRPVCDPVEASSAPCWEHVSLWVDPGGLAEAFMISALPAFLTGKALAGGLGHLGISEVKTFMLCTPVLVSVWYYFLAWFCVWCVRHLRRRLNRRLLQT